ncbi:MAG: hypothetical protein JW797_08095 [Bradymonadales bacterium]|nr:hypothetical protein [Bradymonadales bacterium]
MTLQCPERLLAASLLVATLWLPACGDDTTEPDAGDAQIDSMEEPVPDQDQEIPIRSWEPALFRFTEFNITRPTGIGPILNGLMNLEIRNGRLHILLETMDFAADTGDTTFAIRASSGTKNQDDSYQMISEPTPFSAEIEGDGTYRNTEPGSLSIPVTFYIDPVCDGGPCPDNRCRTNDDCEAGFECGDDPSGQCEKLIQIPLRELTVTGVLTWDEEGNQQLNGMELEGVILKTDADAIQFNLGTNLVSLTEVLDERQMDYPDEGTKTGWWMSAEVNAVEVQPAPTEE